MRYLLIVITFLWVLVHYLHGQWTAMLNMKVEIPLSLVTYQESLSPAMVKGDKIWQSSEYFMNVFCNNALPAHLQEKNTHLHGQI